MKKLPIIFWVIISLAATLRFTLLDRIPPSLSHDEVAIGYNAYSIFKTGRDEYGTRLPLLFRSFDDYKLPGLVYATVPSIALLGLNEIGIRFPSAFMGVLSVAIFWFLVTELFSHLPSAPRWRGVIPFTTLLFALSPWHVNFSRQAFESNAALFVFMLATLFLLRSRRRPAELLISMTFYALSLYFYYSVRAVLPFIVGSFVIAYRAFLIKNIKLCIIAAALGLFISLPLVLAMFSREGLSRMQIVSVTNDSHYKERLDRFVKRLAESGNPLLRFVYNQKTALITTIAENYLKNFSPKHIFFNGTTSFGLQYPIEAPFFILGLWQLFTLATSLKWLFIAWLLSAPLTGAFSVDQPNSLRALLNAPIFSLLSGLGFAWLFDKLKNQQTKIILLFGFLGILWFSVNRFLFVYFVDSPRTRARNFADGHKQMVEYLNNSEKNYDTVYISGYYWRPYIFTLFWKKYDPAAYQREGTPQAFGKYRFTAAEWDKEGVFIYDSDFNPMMLKVENPKKTLFILAAPEYYQHQDKFTKIAGISGRFSGEVFIAATLRPDR